MSDGGVSLVIEATTFKMQSEDVMITFSVSQLPDDTRGKIMMPDFKRLLQGMLARTRI